MKNSPEISIIVAVYKAENYIRRCLDSILAQTFSNIEVLLIDDGSPDRSGNICDEYAALDSRIKVFHKENGGVSSARQYGLCCAKGTFISNIDPDDWVEPQFIELLYNAALENDADVAICNMVKEYRNSRSILYPMEKMLYERNDSNGIGTVIEKCGGGLANKLVRRSIFEQLNISFDERLYAYEDLSVLNRIYESLPSVTYIPNVLYHYDQYSNQNTLTGYDRPTKEFLISRLNYVIFQLESKSITMVKTELCDSVNFLCREYPIAKMEINKIVRPYLLDMMRSKSPWRRKLNVLMNQIGLGCIYRGLWKIYRTVMRDA